MRSISRSSSCRRSGGICRDKDRSAVIQIPSTSLRAKRSNPFRGIIERMDCFVASLLAMTTFQTCLHTSRREAPEVLHEICPSRKRGSRECRMHAAPAVSCAKLCEKDAHENTGSAEAIRHSLRNGFTAYVVLSPATNSFLSPSSADMACLSPVGPTHLRQLDTSNGCQDHTVLPSAKASFVCAPFDRSRVKIRPAIPVRARRCRVHRIPSQRS